LSIECKIRWVFSRDQIWGWRSLVCNYFWARRFAPKRRDMQE